MEATKGLMLHVRWMIRRDIPEVIAIDDAVGFQWGEEEFLRLMRSRNVILNVVEHGEKVVGFFMYELRKKMFQIHTLAVDAAWRRNGVGSSMTNKLAVKLGNNGRNRIVADVPEDNLDFQLFLRSQGFKAVRIDRAEDAVTYRMVYRLRSPEPVSDTED